MAQLRRVGIKRVRLSSPDQTTAREALPVTELCRIAFDFGLTRRDHLVSG